MIRTHTRHKHSYYDAILGIIPAAFLIGIGVALFLGLPWVAAGGLAAGIGGAAIAHALFVRPPVETIRESAVSTPPTEGMSPPDELA